MTNEERPDASVAGDARLRLFCALELAPETVECLTRWQVSALGRVRLVPPEALHVTLAFLGRRPAGDIPAVVRELRAASAAAAPLHLRVGGYRATRGVGMVVLEDVGGAATALADDLSGRLERCGLARRERRPWLPHVTVARFRERAGDPKTAPNTCSIGVVRSALYRSSLGAGGARYEALETAVLGGR